MDMFLPIMVLSDQDESPVHAGDFFTNKISSYNPYRL